MGERIEPLFDPRDEDDITTDPPPTVAAVLVVSIAAIATIAGFVIARLVFG